MIIKLLVDGGDMKPGPTIGQKLGPLGINIGKVITDVNSATKNFKGIQVPVELDINPKTKAFSVNVLSPPTAGLLKKELSIELASGAAKKTKVGNLAIEQVISIAKIKHTNMTASSLKKAVKSVLGSCVSLGILVENKEAKEIEKEIDLGKFDHEIKLEKTELSAEKKKELDKFFQSIKNKQDEAAKKEAELKAAEEAAKLAAPAAAATPAAGKEPGKPAAAAAAGKAEAKPAAKPAAKK